MPQQYAFATTMTPIAIGKDANGALYVVTITGTNGAPPWEIAVLKSTDDGASWAEQDSGDRIDYPETDDTLCVEFGCPRVYFGKNRISIVYSERRLADNLYRNYYYCYLFNMSSYSGAPDTWQVPGWYWTEYFSWDTSDECSDLQIFSAVRDDDNVLVCYSDDWISSGNVIYPGGYYTKIVNNSATSRQLLYGQADTQYTGMIGCAQIAANEVLVEYNKARIVHEDWTKTDQVSSFYFGYSSYDAETLIGESLGYYADFSRYSASSVHWICDYGGLNLAEISYATTGLTFSHETISIPELGHPDPIGYTFGTPATDGTAMFLADKTDSTSDLIEVYKTNGAWGRRMVETGTYDFTGDQYMPWTIVTTNSGLILFVRGPDSARVLWKLIPALRVTPSASGFKVSTNTPTVIAVSFVSYPSADSSLDGWRAQNGDVTAIYEYIDEAEPADADFILNDIDALDGNCIYRCKLSSLSTPSSLNDWYLSTKVWRGTGSPIPTPSIKVRLLEGTTTIAEFTHLDLPTGATRFDDQPTPAELGDITDWTNLYLELEAYYI